MASPNEITIKARWWPLLLADGTEAFLARLQAGSRVVWHLKRVPSA